MLRYNDDANDKNHTLLQIKSRLPNKSLVSRLVAIQCYEMDHEKDINFIQNLECLYLGPPKRSRNGQKTSPNILRRKTINAEKNRDYIALSYTWNPSREFEESTPVGGYHVEQRDSSWTEPSPVRNRVFDRVLRYMEMKDVGAKFLWIGQHCIEQEPGPDKERGMQVMDRVYSQSKFPVALLARPIQSSDELRLLAKILKGSLVNKGGKGRDEFVLSPTTSSTEASRAIKLLKAITDDLWWTRGWTFQENYRALSKMILLIPHKTFLEDEKWNVSAEYLRCDLRGELCVKSWLFHQEATKLCLAFERKNQAYSDLCQSVIARAPKYTILLSDRDADGNILAPIPMSPEILSHISARELKNKWDCLAIAANSCQYSVRLSSEELKHIEPSISLSILGQYLLNGEILSNHRDDAIDAQRAKNLNVYEFIREQAFKRFYSPFLHDSLTFNKGCRFFEVEITQRGIQTRGHLWEICSLLPVGEYSHYEHGSREDSGEDSEENSEEDSEDDLNPNTMSRIQQLIAALYSHGERLQKFIANELESFLEDYRRFGKRHTFAHYWLPKMAVYIASAMDDEKVLCIAQLVGDTETDPCGGAIFVLESANDTDTDRGDFECHDDWTDHARSADKDISDYDDWNGTEERGDETPTFIYTSLWSEKGRTNVTDYNDTHHHVSLVVDCGNISGMRPELFTKEWVHGMCFFEKCPLQDVLFPWPQSLVDLK